MKQQVVWDPQSYMPVSIVYPIYQVALSTTSPPHIITVLHATGWFLHVMFCAVWYHLCNLKNVKNTHGRVLLLVKLA